MARRIGLLGLLTIVAILAARAFRGLDPVAEAFMEGGLPNPALAILYAQTASLQQATATATSVPAALPSPVVVTSADATATPTQAGPVRLTAGPGPVITPRANATSTPPPRPGGGAAPQLPPTIVPVGPAAGQPVVSPSPSSGTARPGGLPPTIAPVQGTARPGQADKAAPTAIASGTATVTPTAGPTQPRPTATLPLVGVTRLTGRIIERDESSLVIRIPNRGEVTVSPGDDTVIQRDNIAVSLATLGVGDTVTLVLGPDNELLRIVVTTRAPDPEPTRQDPENVSNVLAVVWQALLGLVMMGVVLVVDSELRTKFMAALLEASNAYPTGRR